MNSSVQSPKLPHCVLCIQTTIAKGTRAIHQTTKITYLPQNDVPKTFMGHIHALCLQLLGTRIIDISIKDDKKTLIGKTDLSSANVVVHLGVDNCEPRLLIDRYWEGITTVSSIDDAE